MHAWCTTLYTHSHGMVLMLLYTLQKKGWKFPTSLVEKSHFIPSPPCMVDSRVFEFYTNLSV